MKRKYLLLSALCVLLLSSCSSSLKEGDKEMDQYIKFDGKDDTARKVGTVESSFWW